MSTLITLASEFDAALTAPDFAAIEWPEGTSQEDKDAYENEYYAQLETFLSARHATLEERFNYLFSIVGREKLDAERYTPEKNFLTARLAEITSAENRHLSHAARLKKYMVMCLRSMQTAGARIKGEGREFYAQKNGGKPIVRISNRDMVPAQFRVPQEWILDDAAVAYAVEKENIPVEGVTVERGFHLRTKAL